MATPPFQDIINAVKAGDIPALKRLTANSPSYFKRPAESGEPLMLVAARADQVPVIRFLIEHGADVNEPNSKGIRVLHYAAQSADTETVEILIQAGADLNVLSHKKNSPLMLATQHGLLKVMKKLMKAGADLKIKDDQGLSPMLNALIHKQHDALNLLMESGASFDLAHLPLKSSSQALSYLFLSTAIDLGSLGAIKLLVSEGVDIHQKQGGNTILMHALVKEHSEMDIAKYLIEQGVDVNGQGGHHASALMIAAHLGDLECVQKLISAGASETKLSKHDQWNALMFASLECAKKTELSTEDVALLKLLCSNLKALNQKNNLHENALMVASNLAGANSEVVKILVDGGIDVNLKPVLDDDTGKFGKTALMRLASNGNVNAMSHIVESSNLAILDAKAGEDSPLIYAAQNNKVNAIEFLILAGANINHQGVSGYTPLMNAISAESFEATQRLVELGADLKHINLHGRDALALAQVVYERQKDAHQAKIFSYIKDVYLAHEEAELMSQVVNQNNANIKKDSKVIKNKNKKALNSVKKTSRL